MYYTLNHLKMYLILYYSEVKQSLLPASYFKYVFAYVQFCDSFTYSDSSNNNILRNKNFLIPCQLLFLPLDKLRR